MKSLEEVIKYKLNFLPKGIDPFYAIKTYTARRGPNPPLSSYDIYETKDNIFSNDSFSFMEDITPLFIYISSCDKYYRENGHGKIERIHIYLFLDEEFREFGYSLEFGDIADYLKEHRISVFKREKNALFLCWGVAIVTRNLLIYYLKDILGISERKKNVLNTKEKYEKRKKPIIPIRAITTMKKKKNYRLTILKHLS